MTDRKKVYKKVKKTLKKMIPTARQNDLVVLTMMVVGIVLGKKAQLSEMSLYAPTMAKPDSTNKRFRRWVKNKRVEREALYLPFAKQIIAHLAHTTLYLAMDGSQVGRGCMVLMVGVIYKQRVIPLAWLVYKGKKGHTTAQRHIEVLNLVKPLLPEETTVILLGDAEYDNVALLQWVTEETHWLFVMRTSPCILLTQGEQQSNIAQLLPKKEGVWGMAEGVLFTSKRFGPVTVVAGWKKPYKKPLYLVSNHPHTELLPRFYAKRFKIETFFSDQKSRGFHINKSHLSDPARLARLLLAACVAYVWIVYLGVMVQEDEAKRHLIDRPNRADKSLFRLGFDWLKLALTRGLEIQVLFIPPLPPPLQSGVR